MKRIFVLLFTFFFLCGCGGKTANVKPVLNGITFDVKLQFYNEVFVAGGEMSKDNALTLTVKEPETIKGMKLTVKGAELSAEFMGLTYIPKTEQLPAANVAVVFYEMLSDVLYRNPDVKQKENTFFVESAENEKYYKILLSGAGFPLSAEIPFAQIKAQFSNVSVIE